jgi:hypothetical protein
MFRRLLLIVLALWLARLAGLFRPAAKGSVSGFPPADGEPHPAPGRKPAPIDAFSSTDVVDGDFEDVPARPKS